MKHVHVLVINSQQQILCVSRKHDFGNFGLPGGKVDEGETLEQAAKREVLEETSLVINAMQVLYENTSSFGEGTTFIATSFDESQLISTTEPCAIKWGNWKDVIEGSFGWWNLEVMYAWSKRVYQQSRFDRAGIKFMAHSTYGSFGDAAMAEDVLNSRKGFPANMSDEQIDMMRRANLGAYSQHIDMSTIYVDPRINDNYHEAVMKKFSIDTDGNGDAIISDKEPMQIPPIATLDIELAKERMNGEYPRLIVSYPDSGNNGDTIMGHHFRNNE